MTEAEWLACTFPARMLEHLRVSGGASHRKLRLLACACLRLVWHRLRSPRIRAAIEMVEKFLDGKVDRLTLAAVRREAAGDLQGMSRSFWFGEEETSLDVWYDVALHPRGRLCGEVVTYYTWVNSSFRSLLAIPTQRREAVLVRDIFGNPFRPPAPIDPAWLSWEGGAVPLLARAIHEDRAFSQLPVLADALEEAGCVDAEMLEHLRGPGPHVRGCWALDPLLEKHC